MQQGEVILRNTGRDEGFWVGVLMVTAGIWYLLEGRLTQDSLAMLALGLVLAAAVLRLTVLSRWHVYTQKWTLDDEKLTLGDRVLPLGDIDSVGLKKGHFTKGSLFLVIQGRETLRLAALVRGKERARSVESIRALGWAVKQAVENPNREPERRQDELDG